MPRNVSRQPAAAPAPAILDLVVAYVVHLLTTGQGTLKWRVNLPGLLTTQARDSYPWPLAWANAFAGYMCFAKYRSSLPGTERPGFVFSVIACFWLYTMPANLFTNLLCFVRTPSAFVSSFVLPIHVICCCLVEYVPALTRLLRGELAWTVIDSLSVLDCITTGLNYVEEIYGKTSSVPLALLTGVCTNCAGGVARHFYVHGGAGRATFDSTLVPNLTFSLCLNATYLATLKGYCGGDSACVAGSYAYEVLPLVAVARGVLPPLALSYRAKKAKTA